MRLCLLNCVVIAQIALGLQITATAQSHPLRRSRCTAGDAQSLTAWQERARLTLSVLLDMDDQRVAERPDLKPTVLETETSGSYVRQLVEIDARPDRRIKVVVTVPTDAARRHSPLSSASMGTAETGTSSMTSGPCITDLPESWQNAASSP
jgi:hypothetical protein